MGRRLNLKVVVWSLGLFGAITFVLCVIYGLIVPKAFHMVQFLEISLPSFTWLIVGLFLIGLVESFLYGVYADVPLYNFLSRRGQPIR